MAVYSFHYGVMDCGKSTAVLQINYLLKKSGARPILVKPSIDSRDPGFIKSRMGEVFSQPCIEIDETNVSRLLDIAQARFKITDVTNIIVDEAQFLSKDMVWALAKYVDSYNIDVACYGLRTSYTGDLFPGSAALMAIADNLIEMPAPDTGGTKSVMHVRYEDEKPVFEGNPVIVGDIKVDYESVSRKRWSMMRDNS